MGTVLKISSRKKKITIENEVRKLTTNRKKPTRYLINFYGALPDTFQDGLNYQKEVRDEWE